MSQAQIFVCCDVDIMVFYYYSISRAGPRCIKLTSNGKLDFNGNFHRILDADWLWCLVAMVVTIESKVTINGKFYAIGPLCFKLHCRNNACTCL